MGEIADMMSDLCKHKWWEENLGEPCPWCRIAELEAAIDGLPCYDPAACKAWPENDGSDYLCDACSAIATLKGKGGER